MHFYRPTLIGHRGLAGHAPGNSLEALAQARDHGFTWVEVDVQFSEDNEPFLFHDRTPWSQGGPKKTLTRMPWREIQKLQLTDPKTGQSFRIPHLREALTLCRRSGLCVNLELKYHRLLSSSVVDHQWRHIRELAQACRMSPQSILYSSFSEVFEHLAQKRDEMVNVGLLLKRGSSLKDIEARVALVRPVSLHLPLSSAKQESLVSQLLRFQIPIFVYTVNHIKHLSRLLDDGVHGVFTDVILPTDLPRKTEP